MLINQQQRDELELALSCTDHEYRLPVKHKHLKTDITTSGFSREEAKEILIELYRDNGYRDVRNFFRKHRTSHTEFNRVREWFDFDIKRFYRVDDGPIYRLQWTPMREVLKQTRDNMAVTMPRNIAFKKGYGDTRELFVELANVRYSHYYNDPKGFFEVLRKVDISRGTYYSRLRQYGIKAEFFMSVDDGELFPIKSKSSK
ncbi:hypothetical protein AB1Y72_01120 [Escherichia coli]|uniref:hypothetical protein n=1 Tax=Escherichia coli TaxID=562 RepID=UPI00345BDD51